MAHINENHLGTMQSIGHMLFALDKAAAEDQQQQLQRFEKTLTDY